MTDIHLPHSHGNEKRAIEMKHELEREESFQIVADIFKLLSDSSRIRIFWLLCHFEECVFNISALVNMTSPAVSHHLRQLKEGGLIESRRDGKEVYYRASDTEKARLLHLAIEKTMEISCPKIEKCKESHQNETIRQIHDYLMENLDKKITIEDLSKKFLMNTTTLKNEFKKEFGISLAIHMKKHRLEKASRLLKTSTMSIEEISHAVGYESQSKFCAAFKALYSLTPMEYRKLNPQNFK